MSQIVSLAKPRLLVRPGQGRATSNQVLSRLRRGFPYKATRGLKRERAGTRRSGPILSEGDLRELRSDLSSGSKAAALDHKT